jgi:hypothetical protein
LAVIVRRRWLVSVPPSGRHLGRRVSVPVDLEGARKVFKLVDALGGSDDVQNVYSNVDLSDEVLAALDEE